MNRISRKDLDVALKGVNFLTEKKLTVTKEYNGFRLGIEDEGYELSPLMTAREMYRTLDTLERVLRHTGVKHDN